MRRRVAALGVALALLLPLGGCWSRRELQETAFVLALALEETGRNKLRLTVQAALPSRLSSGGQGEGSGGGSGSGETGPVWVASAEGPTVFAALRELERRSSDKLFLAHGRALIVQDKVARAGLQPLLDFMSREPQIRETTQLFVTSDSATEAVKLISPQEKIPVFYLTNLLEHARRSGASHEMDLHRYLVDSSVAGASVAVPRLSIVKPEPKPGQKPGQKGDQKSGDEPPKPTEFALAGMAVFRGQRLRGYLSPGAVPGLLWLKGEVQGLPLSVSNPDEPQSEIAVEIFHGGVERKVVPDEGQPGRTRIRLRAYGEANVREVASYTGRRIPVPEVRAVNRAVSREVAHQIWRSITAARGYRADVFGFAEQAREVIPAYRWNAFARQWPEAFSQCEIEVEADIRLRRRGMTF